MPLVGFLYVTGGAELWKDGKNHLKILIYFTANCPELTLNIFYKRINAKRIILKFENSSKIL
jgi:hypothetical protein